METVVGNKSLVSNEEELAAQLLREKNSLCYGIKSMYLKYDNFHYL